MTELLSQPSSGSGARHSGGTVLIALAILFPLSSYGHHSQAHFSDEFSQMEGVLVDVVWRNPHIKFILRTQNEAGQEELVDIETNSIYYLCLLYTSDAADE